MNRALHHAILLSLALHGLILFGLSVEQRAARRQPPSPPLEARLVEPPAALVEPPAAQPSKAEPAPPPTPPAIKPKAVAKPKIAVKRKPIAKPAPPVEPPSVPPPPTTPPPVSPPVAAPVAPAPPSVARIEPRPAAPQPSAAQIEALTRDQYRLQVLDAARSHNRYPPLARENNWEGQVRVRMEIGPDGRVSVAVEKSSGHQVLDRQAVEMFRRAQAQVPVPPSLRGKALSFELRAIYNLKDQGSG